MLATTLTIVAVFVPIAFMNGIVGQFFRQFGITVSAAVLISLFVAFTLDPMLSARLADPPRALSAASSLSSAAPRGRFTRRSSSNRARLGLEWALRNKLVVAALAIGSIFFMGFIAS